MAARRFYSRSKESPLPGVSKEAWDRFAKALEIQPNTSVSESGGFGTYDIRPRRLVEIGVGVNLRYLYKEGKRSVYECDFKAPWTKEKFLADLMAQFNAFKHSMSLYHKDITSGVIEKPEDVSLSGALAILHIGGRGALKAWPDLFENTRARYEAARGAF